MKCMFKLEYNINIKLEVINVSCLQLTQQKAQVWVDVNMLMKLHITLMVKNSFNRF